MGFSSDIPMQSNQLPLSIDYPAPDSPDFLDTLSLSYKRTVDSMNTKEGGLYFLQEQATFKRLFIQTDPQNFRNIYRSVFVLNPAALTFNHNIVGIVQVFSYWAIANTAGDFRVVPYVDTVLVTNQISMRVTTTQVIITNGATAPAITGGLVVLEYTKN